MHTRTACAAVEITPGGIRVGCDTDLEVTGSHLLIATGRMPNTDRLGIEYLDLGVDGHGFVPVDGQLRAGAEDVWALGDLRGGPMYTHTPATTLMSRSVGAAPSGTRPTIPDLGGTASGFATHSRP